MKSQRIKVSNEPTTLADLRSIKNLSQRGLAGAVGVKPSTIAMYEIGARTPSLANAKKLACFFGVRVDDIFFGKSAHVMQSTTGTEG
jgi:putative transcriptional regulator